MPSAIPARGIRMEDELYLKLKYIAKIQERSFNKQAVFFLQKCVDEYEKAHGTIPVKFDRLYQ